MAKGQMKLLVQMSATPDPQHADTPTILEIVKAEDRPIVELLLARLALGRPFVAPPGVPADRLEVLRKAFRQALEDPELLAEATAQKLAIAPTWGAQAQEMIGKMYATKPDDLERIRKIVRVAP